MFEKSESKTKKSGCKNYALHLRLKSCGIMGGKLLADGEFKKLLAD